MKNLIFVCVLVFTVSCKKEKFPNTDELTGSWIEQTTNSFKHQLLFDDGTVYFFKRTAVDTLSYRLDRKQELIFLTLKNDPDMGESNHKISINKKKKELTIWGLFAGITTSETLFKKE